MALEKSIRARECECPEGYCRDGGDGWTDSGNSLLFAVEIVNHELVGVIRDSE